MTTPFHELNGDPSESQIARHLGLTVKELQEAGWDRQIHCEHSEDGLVYDYFIQFANTAPEYLLAKIPNLKNWRVHLYSGPTDEDDRPNYEDD